VFISVIRCSSSGISIMKLSYLLQYALLSQIQDCVEMQILLVQLMTRRDITAYKSHIFMVLCADHTEK